MAEDPNMRAHNERVRQQTLADQRSEIKKHGKIMDSVAQGGSANTQKGCLGLVALFIGVPIGLYLLDGLVRT
jgi:hypothetical protein